MLYRLASPLVVLIATLVASACSPSDMRPAARIVSDAGVQPDAAAVAPPPVDRGPDAPVLYEVPEPEPEPAVCGNTICEDGETCDLCPGDCGQCPSCDTARSCTYAESRPLDNEFLYDSTCDNLTSTRYSCGDYEDAALTDMCATPSLTFRVAAFDASRGRLAVRQQVFCTISATDGEVSAGVITPLMRIGNNETSVAIDASQGTFWGLDELLTVHGNLSVTYACYRGSASDYADTVAAIGDVAIAAGGIPTGYGWAFALGGVAAHGISSVMAGIESRELFSVSQTIDHAALTTMTNGVQWTVSDPNDSDSNEYFMRIEGWGCARVVTAPESPEPVL